MFCGGGVVFLWEIVFFALVGIERAKEGSWIKLVEGRLCEATIIGTKGRTSMVFS